MRTKRTPGRLRQLHGPLRPTRGCYPCGALVHGTDCLPRGEPMHRGRRSAVTWSQDVEWSRAVSFYMAAQRTVGPVAGEPGGSISVLPFVEVVPRSSQQGARGGLAPRRLAHVWARYTSCNAVNPDPCFFVPNFLIFRACESHIRGTTHGSDTKGGVKELAATTR